MDHDTHDIEELDYDDGLGDIIRSKATSQFSWKKTAIILILFLLSIGLFLGLFLKAGKSILTSSDKDVLTSDTIQYLSDTELKNKIDQIEKENISITKPRAKVQVKAQVNTPISTESGNTSQTKQSMETPKETNTTPVSKPAQSSTKPASADGYSHKVIVGSYQNKAYAQSRQKELRKKGIDTFISTASVNGQTVYRLQASASQNLNHAKAYVDKLKTKGIDAYVMSVK